MLNGGSGFQPRADSLCRQRQVQLQGLNHRPELESSAGRQRMRRHSGKACLRDGAMIKNNKRNQKDAPICDRKAKRGKIGGMFCSSGAQRCHLPSGEPKSVALGF